MNRCVVFLIALFAVGAAGQAFAQGSALIGRVRDAQGGAVVDAEVRVARDDAGVNRSTMSDTAGAYRIADLSPGVFIVEVFKEGFRRRTEIVALAAGAEATFDVA